MARSPRRPGLSRPSAAGSSRAVSNPLNISNTPRWNDRLGPFVAVLFLGLGGLVMHRLWGEPPASLLVTPIMLGLGAFFYWLTYQQSHGRRELVRVHSSMSAGLAAASLGVTTAVGFSLTGPGAVWLQIYGFVGLIIAATWLAPTFHAVSGSGQDTHGPAVDATHPFDTIIAGAKVKVKLEEDNGPRKIWKVNHPGIITEELGAIGGKISSLAGIPITGFRPRQDPDDASVTWVTTVSEDMLKKTTPWPGPSNPGGSCAEPARVGVREDGGDAEIVRPGDPTKGRNSSSVLVVGQTGSGKTEGVLVETCELMTRRDVIYWWIDARKADQVVPDIRPAIDWLADTEAKARAMVASMLTVITERAAMLGQLGYREWVPECYTKYGIPYIVIHLEEATSLLDSLGTAFTRGVEAVRSAGMSISNSLQRPSATNIPTDLRSQFGMVECYGMKTDVDTSMALSEATIEAGAKPEAWGNKKPGYVYIEASHEAEEFHSMPKRTFYMKPVDQAVVTAEFARVMAVADERTAAAAGVAYAQRERVDFDEWLTAAVARRGKVVAKAARRGDALIGTRPTRFERPYPTTGSLPPVAASFVAEERVPVVADLDMLDPESITDAELRALTNIEEDDMDQKHPAEDDASLDDIEVADFPIGPQAGAKYTPTQRATAFTAMLAREYSAGVREISASDIKAKFLALPEGQVTPQWTYWRLMTMEEKSSASGIPTVTRMIGVDDQPIDPRRYQLHPGIVGERAPRPEPETDPDSPVWWSPDDFS